MHSVALLVQPHLPALEKHGEIAVGARRAVGQDAAASPLREQRIALRCAEREAGQPSGEAAAQNEEMPALQQVEEVRWPEVARLQAMAVLEDLFFSQRVVAGRVHAAEEVKDDRLRPRLEISGDVLYLRFLGIGQHLRAPLAVE